LGSEKRIAQRIGCDDRRAHGSEVHELLLELQELHPGGLSDREEREALGARVVHADEAAQSREAERFSKSLEDVVTRGRT
jgi:hypothetical protein